MITKEKRMDATLFESIRNEINRLCRQINASGSNGKVPELMLAIHAHFLLINVPEQDYWNEVLFRTGKGASIPLPKSIWTNALT